jgi:hypothetical protein
VGTLIENFEDCLLRPAVSRDQKTSDLIWGFSKTTFTKQRPHKGRPKENNRNVMSEISAPEFQLLIRFPKSIRVTCQFKESLQIYD